ncbi:hypothetical protein DFH09DRAFT_1096142 [Mycena vulgaris]|nr:hypothetical protein DFH09DRAFT_1096142 [Mycena vulgaris]
MIRSVSTRSIYSEESCELSQNSLPSLPAGILGREWATRNDIDQLRSNLTGSSKSLRDGPSPALNPAVHGGGETPPPSKSPSSDSGHTRRSRSVTPQGMSRRANTITSGSSRLTRETARPEDIGSSPMPRLRRDSRSICSHDLRKSTQRSATPDAAKVTPFIQRIPNRPSSPPSEFARASFRASHRLVHGDRTQSVPPATRNADRSAVTRRGRELPTATRYPRRDALAPDTLPSTPHSAVQNSRPSTGNTPPARAADHNTTKPQPLAFTLRQPSNRRDNGNHYVHLRRNAIYGEPGVAGGEEPSEPEVELPRGRAVGQGRLTFRLNLSFEISFSNR